MSILNTLIKRNIKMYFKDKGLFITSLITPLILLFLYAAFLNNVYKDSFLSGMPAGFVLDDKLLNGMVVGQLVSSLLAVSCVTVPFCSNFLMVQDKANGTVKDLRISPVKPSVLSFSYYIATLISAMLICLLALGACLLYAWSAGWYMNVADVGLLTLDVVILVLFGVALSSVINFFLSSQGQISAVGTLISTAYGFICGAYMPISTFGKGLRRVISFLPGTYGTSLLRNHAMGGALKELETQGLPKEVIDGLKDLLDCNLYFFEKSVTMPAMYAVLGVSVVVLVTTYILLNILKKK